MFITAGHLLLLLLLLVLLGTCFTSVESWVDLKINCGSNSSRIAGNYTWLADTNYISYGVGEEAQNPTALDPWLWNTLRVFTSRKKNCYTIPVDEGEKVLVRASFYYGNYDGKSHQPSFDLQFDGNHWAIVPTTDNLSSNEVIYVTKGNTTSICVALKYPGQFPFINFLEIHSLNSTMYSQMDADRALFYQQRFAYGTDQTTIRDNYDRVWNSIDYKNGPLLIPAEYDGFTIDTFNATDNPPEDVLKHAVTSSNYAANLPLDISFLDEKIPIYMNLYFSEVNSSQDRSFTLYKSYDEPLTDSIVPPYGSCLEIIVANITYYSDTKFYLMADYGFTSPPLINAIEAFVISDPLNNGTNPQDVAALALLQNTFQVLKDWSSDPCLPAPYSWDWVNCNSDTPPRITALYLNSSGLSGSLPDLSSMTSLEIIDLHNNSFNGSIPDFLGSLPNLKQLNLADNNFAGTIPPSLLKLGKNLMVTDNPNLTTPVTSGNPAAGSPNSNTNTTSKSPNSNTKRTSKSRVILATVIPTALIIMVVAAIATVHYKRKAAAVPAKNAGDLNIGSFTLKQIKAATNNFDPVNKIGEGGFGSVYKGHLRDGTRIAVKQLSPKSNQGKREFLNEIGVISTIQHPNLVKLYGCCTEDNQLLVIYEYMENNSLASALFGPKEYQLHLDWPTRHKISVGIARGLTYLHEESTLKIVHRDMKSTNVLLDKDLNPKISDFGMAKLDEQENTHISTRVAGTFGYMAPEYALRGYLTDKADVYSFGVVLLEIVSGRSNISIRPKEDCFYLLDLAHQLNEEGNLMDLIDPRLGSDYNKEEIMLALDICILCTNVTPSERPSMSVVVCMLEGRRADEESASRQSSSNNHRNFEVLEITYDQQVENSNESQTTPLTASFGDLYSINLDSDYRLGTP